MEHAITYTVCALAVLGVACILVAPAWLAWDCGKAAARWLLARRRWLEVLGLSALIVAAEAVAVYAAWSLLRDMLREFMMRARAR